MTEINPKLLEILVCPQTKGRLIYDKEHQELISPLAQCAYSIKEGIPIMLIDEARSLTEDEILKYKKKTS
jgi:uncharacterized protein